MRIFVAGATGFIGQGVVPRLLRESHEIIALSRDEMRARKTLPAVVEIVEGDLGERGGWMKTIDGCDAIISLSGATAIGRRWTREAEREIYRSRVEATANLVRAIEQAQSRPAALLSASGAHYYGDSTEPRLSEDSPPGRIALAQLCVAWEDAARQAEPLGVRVVPMRFGVVLHPSGGALKKLMPLFKLGLGGPLGNGRQGFPWIHREDLAAAIALLLEKDSLAGPVNFVSPHPITNRQFARALGGHLRRPALLPAPAWALRLVFGKGADGLVCGNFAIPAKLQSAQFRFAYPTIEAALKGRA